jgi:hypothetical protein
VRVIEKGLSPKESMILKGFKGARIQGFEGNAKKHRELIVWRKTYRLCLRIGNPDPVFR